MNEFMKKRKKANIDMHDTAFLILPRLRKDKGVKIPGSHNCT